LKLASYAKLAEMLGSMAAQIVKEPVTRLEGWRLRQAGRRRRARVEPVRAERPVGQDERAAVTLVNAPGLAEARGIELSEHKSDYVRNYANLIIVSAETDGGGTKKEYTVSGTCFDGQAARIVQIHDFDIDLKPAPSILLMFYPDRPGMVGKIGTILGEANINIANMAVGRREKRGQAVVALTLDDPAAPQVLQRIREAIVVDDLFAIQLP